MNYLYYYLSGHIKRLKLTSKGDALQNTLFFKGYQLNVTGLRLAGTNGPYHGRVEVEVNGTWGTICSLNMHSWSPYVLCNMLGLA